MTRIIGKPQIRFSKDGRARLEVSQNLAPRRRDDSGQWTQDGVDMWTRGTVWPGRNDWDPDPEAIMEACPQEWRVILEADRVRRVEYKAKDGSMRSEDELVFPRFVGFEPPRETVRKRVQGGPQPATQPDPYARPQHDPWGTPGSGTQHDPWGTPGNDTAPF